MRYHIFAGNNPIIVEDITKSTFSSKKYSEAREYFDKINSEYRFDNSYLIADYCTYTSKSMFTKEMVDICEIYHSDEMPFLPIGEFHYKPDLNESTIVNNAKIDLNLAIRKDMITINADGFSRTFFDNGQAVSIFEQLVRTGTPASMYIKFSVIKNDREVEMERFVANSIDVLRAKKTDLGKIRITNTPYSSIKRKAKFVNMDLAAMGFGSATA